MKIFGCRIFRRGPQTGSNIAITFDDGPHPKFTPMIMDIMEERGGKATFFSTGKNLELNPGLAKEIVERGHLIGNHSYSHPHALYCGRGKLHDEIVRTKDIIETVTGEPNNYFRPPYGFITPSLLSICRRMEFSVILWNSNSKDYRQRGERDVIGRVSKKIGPGSILLFHDCKFSDSKIDYSDTVTALNSVIKDVILRGLKPVTIDELLGESSP